MEVRSDRQFGVAGALMRGSGHQERLERGSRAYDRGLMSLPGGGSGTGADLGGYNRQKDHQT